jgi:hypothetical protein
VSVTCCTLSPVSCDGEANSNTVRLHSSIYTVRSESRCPLRLRYVQVQVCIDARGHHFQQLL